MHSALRFPALVRKSPLEDDELHNTSLFAIFEKSYVLSFLALKIEEMEQPHCAAQVFVSDLFAPGYFEGQSQLVHQLIGVSLFLIVLIWGAIVVQVRLSTV